MSNTLIPSVYWEHELREEKPVDFYPTPSDPSHIVVSRYLPIEGKEVIGHVHVIHERNEIWYVCANRKNREIFPPTSDFSLVEARFQRYAHLLALQQRIKNQRRLITKNLNIKNLNTMKTQTPQPKKQKENQFRFIEYERATGEGHFMTITDSYHNVIGRVHKSFNDETKKYEYVAFDHSGNVFSKSDRLWNVKKEYAHAASFPVGVSEHPYVIAGSAGCGHWTAVVANEKLLFNQTTFGIIWDVTSRSKFNLNIHKRFAWGLNKPVGMIYNTKLDMLFVTEIGAGQVKAIPSEGNIDMRFVSPLIVGLKEPRCVRFVKDGMTMFVCDMSSCCVWKIDLSVN